MRPYKVCTNCVMDTTDSAIVFDAHGVCDHCQTFYAKIQPSWHPDKQSHAQLRRLVEEMKRQGENDEFDCMLGVSGGIDSSYLAYISVKEFGLRPLLFHVDAGWNSQQSTNNIEQLVDNLGVELFTKVIDWEEMRDLQLAYLKAGLPPIDAPQDYAFFYTMYKYAHQHKVKYILTGANYSTECVRNPIEWGYADSVQLRDVHARFGTQPLREFPVAHILWYKIYLPYVHGIRVFRPLNQIRYIRREAADLLVKKLGWQDYPQKHFESRFTKWAEGYWLPRRFGFDTRKVQYSSLILTHQITRNEALERLKTPVYDEETAVADCEYIARKLAITVDELHRYVNAPKKSHRDYRSHEWLFRTGGAVMRMLGMELGGKR